MTSANFTTRMDAELKSRLQKIARQDGRSASFVANQAIENFVAEREATMDLVALGQVLADRGASISETAMMAWLQGPPNAPFPKPDFGE